MHKESIIMYAYLCEGDDQVGRLASELVQRTSQGTIAVISTAHTVLCTHLLTFGGLSVQFRL